MLLKLMKLRELGARFPGSSTVQSMSAEDNRPGLDVDEAVGFLPVSYAAK
jgi:hypothetical protein